jgi:DNA primase
MAFISKATIQEVNDKLDALAVVGEYVRLDQKGGRWWGLCPFHNEKTPSFTVDPDRKMYHCFGCGQGGGVINFLMEMDKLSFPEAIETLARRMGIEIIYERGNFDDAEEKSAESARRARQAEMAELYRRVAVSFHHFLMEKEEGKFAKEYLESRGISGELIQKFRLGYAPGDRNWLFRFLSGKGYSAEFLAGSGLFSERYPGISFFSNRLMFPIADRQGNTIAFGGRILEQNRPEDPKYINSRESDWYKKGDTLFAIDLALPEIRKTKAVYLAEGYMDVISLHQAGITGAVAPLGTAFTDDQAKLLRRWAEKLYLVFDSDEAGQNAAVKAVLTGRRNGLSPALVVPGEGLPGEFKDPADILQNLGPGVLQKSMKCYKNDFEYLVNRGKTLFDTTNPEGKAKAIAFLFPYLETLDSDVSRGDAVGALAGAFGVDRGAVLNDYNRRNTAGARQAREGPVPGEKPVTMNDELFLLTAVAVHFVFYPKFRKDLSIKEIEDPAAKELFIAMEECFVNDESGIDCLLSRISSGSLRNFIAEKGTSGAFAGDPGQIIQDGVKRIKGKRLQRRLSGIVMELHSSRQGNGLEELLEEKMRVDAEIRQLEGR